jgi:hypothetical protein
LPNMSASRDITAVATAPVKFAAGDLIRTTQI